MFRKPARCWEYNNAVPEEPTIMLPELLRLPVAPELNVMAGAPVTTPLTSMVTDKAPETVHAPALAVEILVEQVANARVA